MAKIDTTNWKKFNCEDLFECKNTGNILARDVTDGTGETPFVTASGVNNGVVAHIDASNYDIIPGNCILIGGKTFTVTYQEKDFVSNDSHNFTVRVKNRNTNEFEYEYLVSVIYCYFNQKYSWGDAVTIDRLMKESIPLPTTNDGNPDWLYMESFMKEIVSTTHKNLDTLRNVLNIDKKDRSVSLHFNIKQ